MVQSLGIQKQVSKIKGVWRTSDKQWKVEKVEIWWAFLQKKYIPSAKTLNTVDLSNITFNYLCVDSPNYLCHFWNHKSFFTTQILCIFLAQTLLQKCQYSTNVQIFRLSTAHVEVHQNSSCHLSNKKSVFFFNVWIFFQWSFFSYER